MKTITVKVPASIGNIVCGFDILGLALHEPFDIMEVALTDDPGIQIVHTDNFSLPLSPDENIIGVALKALMNALNKEIGFKVTVHKNIKPGSGLGSSSASCAGAVVAANYMLDEYFTKEQLVEFAMMGENMSNEQKHADNIAPCIYGGVTLARSVSPLDIIQLPVPDLWISIVHPQIEIKTSEARKILPTEISLRLAVQQWGNIAGLVAGIFKNDIHLIGRSLKDVLIEPHRSQLIPGFEVVMDRSKCAGALGGGISGSGPSMFMISYDEPTAEKVRKEMEDIYEQLGIDAKTYVTTINGEGIKIISVE